MDLSQSRVREIFQRVRDLPDPDHRQERLDAECGGDEKLRSDVEALLADETHSVMDGPSTFTADSPSTSELAAIAGLRAGGTLAGRFVLQRKLGEGGMGQVWSAEQTQPVRRDVAVKVIRAGLDSDHMLVRFNQERQALALMDHPSIAKVFDAGIDEVGRPYFVMELIDGVPLTQYCDDQQLTVRERIELLIPICQAVQHAHQKGIIHRDLKPSNILTTRYDNRATPKVIDFGVAKATGSQLVGDEAVTQAGSLIGTLEYMSPEQAELSNVDIDTRSDIYALGVILYELLTGAVPFSRRDLQGEPLSELLRVIRYDEPPTPSTRLSSAERLDDIAKTRKTASRQLSSQVQGELDWIVMKCLEKDRARRYQAASDLAEDLRRFLADEPVVAGPPTVGYRVSRFIRRNRGAVIASGAFVALLLIGMAGTSIGFLRAESARHAESIAKQQAIAKEQEAVASLTFLEERVFKAVRPKGQEGGLGHDVTLREAIEQAVPFVETHYADQPLVQARLRMTLGKSFRFLGDHRRSQEQLLAARDTFLTAHGKRHPDTLSSMNYLAISQYRLGQRAAALQLFEETLQLRKEILGSRDPDTLESMNNLSQSYVSSRDYRRAFELLNRTFELRKQVHGIDDFRTLTTMHNLASIHFRLGDRETGLELYKENYERRRDVLGASHPDTLLTLSQMADALLQVNRLPEAVEMVESFIADQEEAVGKDHEHTLITMNVLSQLYSKVNRHEDSLRIVKEIVARRKRAHPDEPVSVGDSLNLCRAYHRVGKHEEGIKAALAALEEERLRLGMDEPRPGLLMENVALGYSYVGRDQEAYDMYTRIFDYYRKTEGMNSTITVQSLMGVSLGHWKLGRRADAIKASEQVVAGYRQLVSPGDARLFTALGQLRQQYYDVEDYANAIATCDELLAKQTKKFGANNPATISSTNLLAWFLSTADKPELFDPQRAVELSLRATAVRPGVATYWGTRGTAQYRAGQWEPACESLKQAIQLRKPDSRYNASDGYFLAMSYQQRGEKMKAREWFERAEEWAALNKAPHNELARFRAEAESLLR